MTLGTSPRSTQSSATRGLTERDPEEAGLGATTIPLCGTIPEGATALVHPFLTAAELPAVDTWPNPLHRRGWGCVGAARLNFARRRPPLALHFRLTTVTQLAFHSFLCLLESFFVVAVGGELVGLVFCDDAPAQLGAVGGFF